ncbi:hypothetical protein [Paraburkholderia adhaesiva]|nr:hypothetical protein [Paraburkholderia adhaesiva]
MRVWYAIRTMRMMLDLVEAYLKPLGTKAQEPTPAAQPQAA